MSDEAPTGSVHLLDRPMVFGNARPKPIILNVLSYMSHGQNSV